MIASKPIQEFAFDKAYISKQLHRVRKEGAYRVSYCEDSKSNNDIIIAGKARKQ